MSEHSISERGYEAVPVEVDLLPCPLCGWSVINAIGFHEPGRSSSSLAKIACGRCGCRITGGSVKDLVPRWNNRPVPDNKH